MSQEMQNKIKIEVAYATPEKQLILSVSVDQGATLFDAAKLSGICDSFPEIDLENSDMGIFGKSEKTPKTTLLREGDRVEIYRALIADPKEVRKKRAEAAKQNKENKQKLKA